MKKKYVKILLLAIASTLVSCKKGVAFKSLPNGDYVIYERITNHVLQDYGSKYCYILNKTFIIPGILKDLEANDYIYKKYASFPLSELSSSNKISYILKYSGFKLNKVRMIQQEKDIVNRQENDIFLKFSKISYNQQKDKAILYYSVKKMSHIGGETALVGMIKRNGLWKIKISEFGWVY